MTHAHHHAYLYEGALSQLDALAASARAFFGFEAPHNPDVHALAFEKFGIEEARELVASVSLKSVSGRALYILGMSSVTAEAQQALLKLFEEPQEGTTIVLLAPYGSVIATLRSRLLPYPDALAEDGPLHNKGRSSAAAFLQASAAARSAEITALLKDDEGVKDRVRGLLDGLESELHKRLKPGTPHAKGILQGLEDIARVRSYVGDRSPSLKMLLEYVALSLPTL